MNLPESIWVQAFIFSDFVSGQKYKFSVYDFLSRWVLFPTKSFSLFAVGVLLCRVVIFGRKVGVL